MQENKIKTRILERKLLKLKSEFNKSGHIFNIKLNGFFDILATDH